ncbi:membrane hypothetical protein [Vibrio chagasii]|nr:membrane hypothetical protein [Vibrio chagasii]
MTAKNNNKKLWFLFALLGGCYLILESSFIINLLNAIHQNKVHTLEDVDKIGRTLSGIGMGILVAKFITYSKNIHKKTVKFALLAVLPMSSGALTYELQGQLVDAFEKHTPLALKQEIYNGYIYQKAVTSGAYNLSSFTIDASGVPSELSKVFLGTFGVYSIGSDLYQDYDTASEVAGKTFEYDYRDNKDFYYSKYQEASERVIEDLEWYFEARRSATNIVRFEANKAYADVKIKARTARRAYNRGSLYNNPNNDDQKFTDMVRAEIYKEIGLNLPRTWRVVDKNVFLRAFEEKFFSNASAGKQFREAIHKESGIKLQKDHLSVSTLLREPAIQKAIKPELGIFKVDGQFNIGLNKGEFDRIHGKQIPKNMAQMFKDNSTDEETLNLAFRAALVPLVAVSFSVLFLTLNATSLAVSSIVLWALKGTTAKTALLTKVCSVAFVITAPFVISNPFNTNPRFFQFVDALHENSPAILGWFYEWVIASSLFILSFIGENYIPMF